MKKFELTENSKILSCGRVVFQTRALKSFGNVKKGDLGGYIEKEKNLSHKGNAWVYGNACVFCNAKVCGNAKVMGNASVYGNAKVYGNATVMGNSRILMCAKVHGNAVITGECFVYDRARVYGNAVASGYIKIRQRARIFGDVCVSCVSRLFERELITVHPSSAASFLSAFEKKIYFRYDSEKLRYKIECGCFCGEIADFKKIYRKRLTKGYLAVVNSMEKVFII